MKRVIVLAILLAADMVWAQCWTETTFLPDGRTVFCQVCNYGGQITRTCF